jgi:hypothetical protein
VTIKPCSPLHPVNVGLLLLGAGAIGLAARGQGSRNAQIPDLSFSRLRDGQSVDAERDYRANGVTFSAASGVGQVSDSAAVNHKGFVVWMRPSQFLSLNPPLPKTQAQQDKIKAWHKSLDQGVILGPPVLFVDLEDDAMDDDDNVLNGNFVVRNHEGRHRMTAIMERSDEPVPVHVIPGHYLRARHFQRFDFGSATFRPRSMGSYVRVRPKAWALDGVLHKTQGSRSMLFGFDDFGGPQEPVRTTRADLFRTAGIGHTFRAHGREWKVVNTLPDKPGHRVIAGNPRQVVRVGGRLEQERELYAYLDGETLVVHALSKHGPFAPVGRVLWREDMSDEVR